jgi:hypothetical protein
VLAAVVAVVTAAILALAVTAVVALVLILELLLLLLEVQILAVVAVRGAVLMHQALAHQAALALSFLNILTLTLSQLAVD